MKVTVNKCPYTGKLFEDDLKYSKHLRRLQAERRAKRKDEKIRNTFSDWLAAEKSKITEVKQIVPWFMDNQRTIMDAANAIVNNIDRYGKFTDLCTYSKLEISGPRWNRNVSNSHRCPVGGVVNWGGHKPGLPTGYPGWTGHIAGSLTRPKNKMGSYPTSDILNLIGLHTGSGGGGNESWSYGLSIFLDDWPGLQHEVDMMEQDYIVRRLMGR